MGKLIFRDRIIDDILKLSNMKELLQTENGRELFKLKLEKINKYLPDYDICITDGGQIYKSNTIFDTNVKNFFSSLLVRNHNDEDVDITTTKVVLSIYSKNRKAYRLTHNRFNKVELHLSDNTLKIINDVINDNVTFNTIQKDYFQDFKKYINNIISVTEVINQASLKSDKYRDEIIVRIKRIINEANHFIGTPMIDILINNLFSLNIQLHSTLFDKISFANNYLNLESTKVLPIERKQKYVHCLLMSMGLYGFKSKKGKDNDITFDIHYDGLSNIVDMCLELSNYVLSIKDEDAIQFNKEMEEEMLKQEIIDEVKKKFNVDISNIIVNKSIDEIKNIKVTYTLYI